MPRLKIEVFGPLVFWTLMIVVGAAIRLAAFQDVTIWIHLSPEAALWATGILFSLAVSEQTYYRARLVPQIRTDRPNAQFTVSFDVTLPDEVGFTPCYIYLFFVSVAVWILCLLMSGYSAQQFSIGGLSAGVISFTSLSYSLAAFVVTTSLWSLAEVSRS